MASLDTTECHLTSIEEVCSYRKLDMTEEIRADVPVTAVEDGCVDENGGHSIDIGAITQSDKSTQMADDALDYLRGQGNQTITFTDAEALKVRWKIDLILMPQVSLLTIAI